VNRFGHPQIDADLYARAERKRALDELVSISEELGLYNERPIDHILKAFAEYEKRVGRKPARVFLTEAQWLGGIKEDAKALGLLQYDAYADEEKLAGVAVDVWWNR
jgi:hypothetical protein